MCHRPPSSFCNVAIVRVVSWKCERSVIPSTLQQGQCTENRELTRSVPYSFFLPQEMQRCNKTPICFSFRRKANVWLFTALRQQTISLQNSGFSRLPPLYLRSVFSPMRNATLHLFCFLFFRKASVRITFCNRIKRTNVYTLFY